MRFGIREVANVTFRTLSEITIGEQTFTAGEPVLYFESLKASTLTGSANTVFATGGRGANKLIGWDGDKEVVFTIEDALISQESFAILSGADLVSFDGSASKAKEHNKELLQLDASEEVTLAETALESDTDHPIYIYLSNQYGEIGDKIPDASFTANPVIAFTAAANVGLVENAWVIVDYYYESTNAVKRLIVKVDSFGGYFKVEGDSLWRRESDGVDLPARLTIPRAKIRTNFEFSMTPDGDPSTFTFELDAFPATVFGTINVLFVLDVEEI